MITSDGKSRLVLNLKKEWYDKIASGEKTVEYRKFNDYWARRLLVSGGDWRKCDSGIFSMRHYDEIELRLGYSRKNAIVRNVSFIDIGLCPYEKWTGMYFRIHFNKGE